MTMTRTLTVTVILLLSQRVIPEEVRWEKDWQQAFQMAKAQHKLVFVDFYADWCGPCKMMDANVFPVPQVQERLREYVLLRLDIERALPPGLKVNVRALPTYTIYDFDERERFTFFGAMPASNFASVLDLAREAMPFMIRAAELFRSKDDLHAWMQVAKGYSRARASEKSRAAWERVQRAAESQGDTEAAQIATINSAFTWVMDGKVANAVSLLKKIAASAVSKETEALSWFMIGQAYVVSREKAQARVAFEKAKALVSGDHVLARQATAALAELPRQ